MIPSVTPWTCKSRTGKKTKADNQPIKLSINENEDGEAHGGSLSQPQGYKERTAPPHRVIWAISEKPSCQRPDPERLLQTECTFNRNKEEGNAHPKAINHKIFE